MTAEFIPKRSAALERLSAFVPNAGRAYAARRNYDLGPGNHAHVSMLSPYLRCRLLTEEEVLQSVLGQHSYAAAEKFVQEVCWRTYWKGWLELRPGIWDAYGHELTRAWNDVQTQAGLRARWQDACHGSTGIDCFDAWAQELVSTGYLHNHARMWFASIWIFTLELPWTLGADFFMRHLLDGDPASNTLSWRWVAGLQTQGKTYLASASNIAKYTEGRFQPKWQLASKAEPMAAPAPPATRSLPPEPTVVPEKRTGFLLHEEDLSPAFILDRFEPRACAVLNPQATLGPLLSAPHVSAFRKAAQQDVLDRWNARLGPATEVTDAASILTWSQTNDIEQIVTPYAPSGPVALVLSEVAAADAAPVLCQIRRAYDTIAWPNATKGFFPFKKKLPGILERLKIV